MSVVRRYFEVFCLSMVLTGTGEAIAYSAEPSDAAFRASLAAGEFSTALAVAEKLPAAERDAALRDLAAAQDQVGAGGGSLVTVGGIRDDRLRQDVLGQMFGQTSGTGGGFAGDARGTNRGNALGGGVEPDFDSLIELMESTIAPETWRTAGGTQGEVKSHAGGVFVDAQGAMRPIVNGAELAGLAALRRDAARGSESSNVRRPSQLRKVSLTRLERELQIRAARGLPIEEELQALAGLQKIQYVFVYPQSGDVVLAGPAGDWYLGRENRRLSVENDRPVVLLDDLITLLRREFAAGGEFGCSIDPTAEGIRRLTAFVTESNKKPLAPGGRGKWTDELGKRLGTQNVSITRIDPTSHAAQVLVEADYRMKLLGIGKEESIVQVPSYLQIVADSKPKQPPALDLVRWWFTMNYDALLTSAEHDVYELRGTGVKLLGENEFLAAQGERVGTGQANTANQLFAANFTTHFAALARKYPIYSELQNIFDLALVAAVLKYDGVCDRIQWRRTGLMSPAVYQAEQSPAPRTVETVAASRELSRTLILATASGGVTVDVASLARPEAMQVDDRGQLTKVRQSQRPTNVPARGWWWD